MSSRKLRFSRRIFFGFNAEIILLGAAAAALVLFFQTSACAQQDINSFFVYDGRSLSRVENADPNEIKVTEWQVWLFRNGKSTADKKNRWGLHSGKTAAEVMTNLKKAQKLELDCNAMFGRGRVPDEVLTYFNPVGPIAVVERASAAQERMDKQRLIPKETWDKMQNAFTRAQEYYKGYQNISDILSREPGTQTPFDNVGNVFFEYRDNLLDAMDRVTALRVALDDTLTPALEDIGRRIDEITSRLDTVERAAQRVGPGLGISASVLAPPGGQAAPSEYGGQTSAAPASVQPSASLSERVDTETQRLLTEFQNIDPNNLEASMKKLNELARQLARMIESDPESTADMKELAKLLIEITGSPDLEKMTENLERLNALIERIKP